jgi:hypothetical protein
MMCGTPTRPSVPAVGWVCRSSVALGHSQVATTARYAHLDNDPLRRASETIAGRIEAALNGKKSLEGHKRR